MLTRIITGIVGIALMAFIIQTGGTLFAASVLVLSLVAWFEYVQAFSHRGGNLTFVLGLISLVLLWGCAWLGNDGEMLLVISGTVLLILLASVLLHGRISFVDACTSIAGILYFGLSFGYVVQLRFLDPEVLLASPLGNFEFGCAIIWVMFIGTWASDTFAYFVGSAIGSHKLCPSISPNKTIEGFLGSVVGTTASVYGLSFFFGLPQLEMAGLGFAISLLATLGDLVESVAKRYTGIKDFARVLGIPMAVSDGINKKLQVLANNDPKASFKFFDKMDSGEFRKLEEENKELFRLARKFEGSIRQWTTHASGIIACPESLIGLVPTRYDPKKGETVDLTPENLPLYARIISDYEHNTLGTDAQGQILVNGEPAHSYTFKQDYYFMMGDNRHNSLDSRYWGFVPEDHIVGRPAVIWLSTDGDRKFPHNIRWRRFLKFV